MAQLLQPQEIEVFYVLPTIRKYLTQYMKEMEYNQKKIAQMLHIRESTVSQYLSDKRGAQISFSPVIATEIQKAAVVIATKGDLIRETQRILALVRSSGALCEIHKKLTALPSDCDIKGMGCA